MLKLSTFECTGSRAPVMYVIEHTDAGPGSTAMIGDVAYTRSKQECIAELTIASPKPPRRLLNPDPPPPYILVILENILLANAIKVATVQLRGGAGYVLQYRKEDENDIREECTKLSDLLRGVPFVENEAAALRKTVKKMTEEIRSLKQKLDEATPRLKQYEEDAEKYHQIRAALGLK